VDIEIRDFYDMDAGVPILCAAPGTVVQTHDGEFDRQTQWLSGVTANDVIVQHADGSYAYYWHMRKGSVRVITGQAVATGDTLGFVGSSGYSSGPHLHFETQDGGTREPYLGPCNPGASRWLSQGPYVWTYPFQLFNSGLTTLRPSWATVCERPPSKTNFTAGSPVYGWVRVRNILSNDQLTYQWYSPLGPYSSSSFSAGTSYTSSYWYAGLPMPTSPSYFGSWHLDILRNAFTIASIPYVLDGNANQAPTIPVRTLWVRANGSIDVDLAGQDADGSVFWHNLLTGPAHGAATLGNTRRHLLHYVPTPGYVGPDSVTVYATDDENLDGPATVVHFNISNLLAVGPDPAPLLELGAPWPNPVRAGSRITFDLPAAGGATLDLLDVGGRRAASWSGAGLAAGPHELAWETLAGGRPLAPGLYFVRLKAAGATRTRRVSVLD
jgi:hypothetical protein